MHGPNPRFRAIYHVTRQISPTNSYTNTTVRTATLILPINEPSRFFVGCISVLSVQQFMKFCSQGWVGRRNTSEHKHAHHSSGISPGGYCWLHLQGLQTTQALKMRAARSTEPSMPIYQATLRRTLKSCIFINSPSKTSHFVSPTPAPQCSSLNRFTTSV